MAVFVYFYIFVIIPVCGLFHLFSLANMTTNTVVFNIFSRSKSANIIMFFKILYKTPSNWEGFKSWGQQMVWWWWWWRTGGEMNLLSTRWFLFLSINIWNDKLISAMYLKNSALTLPGQSGLFSTFDIILIVDVKWLNYAVSGVLVTERQTEQLSN